MINVIILIKVDYLRNNIGKIGVLVSISYFMNILYYGNIVFF